VPRRHRDRDRRAGARAEVPARDRDLTVEAEGPKGKILLDLQVHGIQTGFGQQVLVCGDAPELGEMGRRRAVRLGTSRRDLGRPRGVSTPRWTPDS